MGCGKHKQCVWLPMPHFKEAWCSGVDFLYSIDYEGMLDQGEIGADRDVLSLGADELRLLPADTAPVGVGAVPGALLGRKTGEPLPSAVSSARVLKLVGGTEGDPLTWLPLDGFKDESWREGSGLPYRVGQMLQRGPLGLTKPQMQIMKDCMSSLASSRD